MFLCSPHEARSFFLQQGGVMKVTSDYSSKTSPYDLLSEKTKEAGLVEESIKEKQRSNLVPQTDTADISENARSAYAASQGKETENELTEEEKELEELEKKFKAAGGGSSDAQANNVEKLREQIKEAKEKLQKAQEKLQKAMSENQDDEATASNAAELEAARMEVSAAQTELQALQSALVEALKNSQK